MAGSYIRRKPSLGSQWGGRSFPSLMSKLESEKKYILSGYYPNASPGLVQKLKRKYHTIGRHFVPKSSLRILNLVRLIRVGYGVRLGAGTKIGGGGGGGGGGLVNEDWSGGLGLWTPYFTQDTTEDISGDYFCSQVHCAPEGTWHLRNNTNHAESEVLISDTVFPDNTKAGYIKAYVACGGLGGSVRTGFIYGGQIDGSNDYDTGVICYTYEDQDNTLGNMVNGGGREYNSGDTYNPVIDTYYYYTFYWDDEVAGNTTFYSKAYASNGGALLSSTSAVKPSSNYPTGQWGIFLSNADNNQDNDWGPVEAGVGAP